MLKLIYSILLTLTLGSAFSQQNISEIKDGTRLSYLFDMHGQKRVIVMVLKMPVDSLIIEWTLRSSSGTYLILPEALKTGSEMSFKRGEIQHTIELKASETFAMISRSAFQELLSNGQFVYNNTVYVLNKEEKMEVDGKLVNTLHVMAQIDETEMWIMTNPQYPMIGKIIKNPLGINFTLTALGDTSNGK